MESLHRFLVSFSLWTFLLFFVCCFILCLPPECMADPRSIIGPTICTALQTLSHGNFIHFHIPTISVHIIPISIGLTDPDLVFNFKLHAWNFPTVCFESFIISIYQKLNVLFLTSHISSSFCHQHSLSKPGSKPGDHFCFHTSLCFLQSNQFQKSYTCDQYMFCSLFLIMLSFWLISLAFTGFFIFSLLCNPRDILWPFHLSSYSFNCLVPLIKFLQWLFNYCIMYKLLLVSPSPLF